jgi:hypothetical protein
VHKRVKPALCVLHFASHKRVKSQICVKNPSLRFTPLRFMKYLLRKSTEIKFRNSEACTLCPHTVCSAIVKSQREKSTGLNNFMNPSMCVQIDTNNGIQTLFASHYVLTTHCDTRTPCSLNSLMVERSAVNRLVVGSSPT